MGVMCEHVRGIIDRLKDIGNDLKETDAKDLDDGDRAAILTAATHIMTAIMSKSPHADAAEEYRTRACHGSTFHDGRWYDE